MNPNRLAAAVIIASFVAGVLASLGTFDPDLELDTKDSGEGLVYDSAHEHALFYVNVNGTDLDFTGERFQLNSRYVHLENRRSHIVHKHAKGVTWSDFLQTINVSIERGDGLCVDIYNRTLCGRGRLHITGGGLNSTIDQDDIFVLALGENASRVIEEYRDKKLPDEYRPGLGA